MYFDQVFFASTSSSASINFFTLYFNFLFSSAKALFCSNNSLLSPFELAGRLTDPWPEERA